MARPADRSARTVMPWPLRLRLAGLTAAMGLALCVALLQEELASVTQPGGWIGAYLVFAAGVGAFLAGLAVAGLLGRPGRLGWPLTLCGMLLGTLLGGAVGGTLVLPGAGTFFGPVVVFGHMADRPGLIVLFLAFAAAVHLAARRLRAP